MFLTLMKSTASVNGGFINTLQNKTSIQTVFGSKDSQITYYMKTKDQVPVGTSGELDLGQFNVVERPYEIDDPTSENHGQTVQCKWLELKPLVKAIAQAVATPVVAPVVEAQALPVTQQPVVN